MKSTKSSENLGSNDSVKRSAEGDHARTNWGNTEMFHSASTCHWRDIIFSMADMIFVLDPDKKFLFCHAPEKRNLYSDPEKFIGKSYAEIMPPELNGPFEIAFERNRNGDVAEFEYSLDISDGTFWFQAKLSPIILDDEYKGSVAVVRDITPIKKVEKTMHETEEKYRHIFENSIIGIYSTTPEGHILMANPALVKMLGYSSFGELSKRNLNEDGFEPGYSRTSFQEIMERHGEVVGLESAWRRMDGSTLFIRENASAVKDDSGNIAYYEGTVENITERKKAEEALMESKMNFKTVVDNANDGILIGMGKGKHVYANMMASEMTGYSIDELLNLAIKDLAHPDERKKILARYKKRMKGENVPNKYETYILRKDGHKLPVEITAAITVWKGENADLVIMRDISERKRTENEIRKRLLKFRLEIGNIYMVKEAAPALSIDAINDLLSVGYSGLIISRWPERELGAQLKGEYDYLWLSERKGKRTIRARAGDILKEIGACGFTNVILIDRLDYIVSRMGFKKTLRLIQDLKEVAYYNDNIIIISIDPETLSPREAAQLIKETREIIPLQKAWLPDSLFEVLKFIYNQNRMGIKPSHTKASRDIGISKPTAGKRIRQLIELGYVMEGVKGKSKVLELTPEGTNLFMK